MTPQLEYFNQFGEDSIQAGFSRLVKGRVSRGLTLLLVRLQKGVVVLDNLVVLKNPHNDGHIEVEDSCRL